MAQINIEPGGEYLLGYAKKRLAELKMRIAQYPATGKSETTQGPNAERITVSSMGGVDRISIQGGQSFWLGDALIPSVPTPPEEEPTPPDNPEGPPEL